VSTDIPTPLLYLVKRVELAVRKNLDAVLEVHGLTTIQYTALTTLARHDGMTAAALARYSFVAPQTMAQLVGLLEARSWVDRIPDPESRRRQLLVLTDGGRRLLDDLREPVAEVETRMVAETDDADLAVVRSALRTFGSSLEPQTAPVAALDDESSATRRTDRTRPRTRRGSPTSLLLTVFGDYWSERSEALPSAAIVSVLGDFGVSEAAARTSLSRMVKHGLLSPSRAGRKTGYRPTARSDAILSDTLHRIVAFGGEERDWDGSWSVVLVDDDRLSRSLRDAVRSRMEWLGFARLVDGLWLSPWDRHATALEELAKLGVVDDVTTLTARVPDELPGPRRPEEAWDLVQLDLEYRAFLAEARRLRDALAAGVLDPAEALVHRTGLTDEWIALIGADPDLPRDLLPGDWPRSEAREAFFDTHEALGERAISRVSEAVAAVDPTLADLVVRRSFRDFVSQRD
jgi:phenylacetic acid degradation operon negative regulatory protein